MKRILLMYISNNSGHHQAARAIEETLHLISPNIAVRNINCFNYTNPMLEKFINGIYNNLIKNTPEVWDYLYDNPGIVRRTKKLRRLIHKFNSKKLKKLIDDFKPDAVCCTQAFPCGMVADFKKTYGLNIPLVGVLTDYAPHSYWIYDNIDAYVVPCEQTKNRFIKNGIDRNKIHVFGIPINPRFGNTYDKELILKESCLEKDVPIVLIMGGSQGLGPIEDLIFAINTIEENLQVIVVCGTNHKLKKWLEKRKNFFRKKMAIFGYVKEIDMLMEISDFIVSKPGGLTTAEALSKGLPIVIINPLPGQEAKNAEFLLREKVAVMAKSPLDAAIFIEELLADPARLNRMKEAAQRHARPKAAEKTAKLLLNLIPQER